MKKMIGIFALLLFAFSAPVSFASNGPETTKECVIDNAIDMESLVVVDQIQLSTVDSVVLSNVVKITSVVTMVVDSNSLIRATALKEEHVKILFNVLYGLPSIQHKCHFSYLKTNGLAYKYNNPNCRARQLTKSVS